MLRDALHRSAAICRLKFSSKITATFHFFFSTLIAPVHAPIRTSAGLTSRVDNVVSRRYALLNRVLLVNRA